jgi:S1-C subfamily serine protease
MIMQSRYPPPQRGQGQRNPDLFSQKPPDEMLGLMMPKTVVSLAIWLLMFALGAGLSGLLFFVIYQGQLNSVEERLIKSQQELSKKVDEGLRESAAGTEGSSEFKSSSLRKPTPEDESRVALEEVMGIVGPSLAVIEGLDSAGAPTTGSGFVINNTGDQSWILTNHHLVAGAIGDFKTVRVRLGGTQLPSEVYSSDPSRDLALVIFNSGARALRFAKELPKTGEPVWAAGAAKGASGSAVSGVLTDATALSLVTDVRAPAHFSGGPLVNRDGRVLGVLSMRPAPPGAEPSPNMAVPIELACVEVVRCPRPVPSATPTPGRTARPQPTNASQTPSGQPENAGQTPPGQSDMGQIPPAQPDNSGQTPPPG